MKQVKFRVWDVKAKIFLLLGEGVEGNINETKNELYNVYNNGTWSVTNGYRCLYGSKGEIIIQQFTGLKDNKNQEIYEGDIIYMAARIRCMGEKYKYGIVQYDESKAAFVVSWGGNEGGYLPCGANIRVVGNIFENKNLLK